MPPQLKLTMGRGAFVSCLARMMHPKRVIRNMFPNMNKNKRLAICIVKRLEIKTIRRCNQTCLVVQCDKVMEGDNHIEIYANSRYFKTHAEGSPDGFFNAEQFGEVVNEEEDAELPTEVVDIFNLGRASTKIKSMHFVVHCN
jgi:hypothetical protein